MGLTRDEGAHAVSTLGVSQLGMLAGHDRLRERRHPAREASTRSRGILSPGLLGSFVLLGLFPLIAKWIVNAASSARKVYAKVGAPQAEVASIATSSVIGAGAAGLVTSYIAAVVKAKVTLVEAHKMGGDCLNYGCVPSKALIKHRQRCCTR